MVPRPRRRRDRAERAAIHSDRLDELHEDASARAARRGGARVRARPSGLARARGVQPERGARARGALRPAQPRARPKSGLRVVVHSPQSPGRRHAQMEGGISAAPSLAHDLYERYSGQIFGFCVNRLGSREEAEDALQSTFLNAHRALQRGVTPDAELPWLFKIAHNVCLTRRRSTRRRGRVEAPSDLESVQDVVPAPPRESRDELIELTGALTEMPDNQRRAILLREWQGLSYHEIARELELSPSAVETLIFRARRTLAANLESRPGLLARARQALDLGGLVTAAKRSLRGRGRAQGNSSGGRGLRRRRRRDRAERAPSTRCRAEGEGTRSCACRLSRLRARRLCPAHRPQSRRRRRARRGPSRARRSVAARPGRPAARRAAAGRRRPDRDAAHGPHAAGKRSDARAGADARCVRADGRLRSDAGGCTACAAVAPPATRHDRSTERAAAVPRRCARLAPANPGVIPPCRAAEPARNRGYYQSKRRRSSAGRALHS